MKFGKLPSVDNVDFTLPPDPETNAKVLPGKPAETPRLYIGATGWGMRQWVGKYYPKGTKSKDYLQHYGEQFNTIELNTTHYRTPDELTIQKWHEQTPDDFRFCPKVLQRISHSRGLSPEGPLDLTRQFCEAVVGLKEKLGPCFIQLPPYFGIDRLPVLEVFLEKWNRYGIPLAVEVRHESWFDNHQNLNQLARVLEKYGAFAVITDVAGRRDVCHMRLTGQMAMVRFVGNDLHPSDYSRIDAWAERLRVWFENGLENAYIFTHEPDNLLAPELATYLYEKMKSPPNLETRGPIPINQNTGGEQMSLF